MILQVEDMLRRSFAEFHAQRAQPGKSAALAAGVAQLDVYRNTPWPQCIKGCDKQQLMEYCELNKKIADITEQLQVGNPQAIVIKHSTLPYDCISTHYT